MVKLLLKEIKCTIQEGRERQEGNQAGKEVEVEEVEVEEVEVEVMTQMVLPDVSKTIVRYGRPMSWLHLRLGCDESSGIFCDRSGEMIQG